MPAPCGSLGMLLPSSPCSRPRERRRLAGCPGRDEGRASLLLPRREQRILLLRGFADGEHGGAGREPAASPGRCASAARPRASKGRAKVLPTAPSSWLCHDHATLACVQGVASRLFSSHVFNLERSGSWGLLFPGFPAVTPSPAAGSPASVFSLKVSTNCEQSHPSAGGSRALEPGGGG